MEYDPPSMGVWFDAQEDALSAGRRLKAKTNAEYCVIAYEGRQDLLREMQRVLLEDREIKWKYVMDEGANDEEK